MDQEKLLRSATAWQRRKKQTTNRFGLEAQEYLKARKRTFEKNSDVVDAFQQVLPQQLNEHCQLVKISSGQVYIEVEPGPYMHEMQMLSSELLEHIKGRCPYSGVKKIILRPKRSAGEKEIQ